MQTQRNFTEIRNYDNFYVYYEAVLVDDDTKDIVLRTEDWREDDSFACLIESIRKAGIPVIWSVDGINRNDFRYDLFNFSRSRDDGEVEEYDDDGEEI